MLEDLGNWDLLDKLGLQDQLVTLEVKDPRDHRDPQVNQDQQDSQEIKDKQV